MIEIVPNLFVGSQDDVPMGLGNEGWYVISAARDPWHRHALGYTGRGAPKDHPEYLWAARPPNRLILNLVDANDPAYIPDEIINTALGAIKVRLASTKVLIHCNKGQSRAPTIAMLYLRKHSHELDGLDYAAGVEKFRTLYPPYAPARGMAEYARQHWDAE